MVLSLLNFNAIVSNSSAAVQASCNKLLNLTKGSVLRAILEAFASVGLWFQYLIVQVWLGTRLATSAAADADSFVNDFTMTRLPAIPSSGQVTFSRFSTDNSALIVPYYDATGAVSATPGVQVTTLDGTQAFGVITDTTNQYWNATLGGYLVPVGVASINVTVQALFTGAAGNVQAGTIGLISSAIFMDTVTNASPFLNGADQESDTALKARFANFINTRARGTPAAVEYAITSVQQNLSYSLRENTDAAGNYLPGNFVVMIEDGSAPASPTLVSAVYAAIDAVRPIGSTFSVLAPTVINVTVSLSITVGPNGNKNVLIGQVENAILDYIDSLPIAAVMPWSILAKLAWDTDRNITNVSQILLNGRTFDIDPGASGVVRAGTVAIN